MKKKEIFYGSLLLSLFFPVQIKLFFYACRETEAEFRREKEYFMKNIHADGLLKHEREKRKGEPEGSPNIKAGSD